MFSKLNHEGYYGRKGDSSNKLIGAPKNGGLASKTINMQDLFQKPVKVNSYLEKK